jgi:hypothetical protein
MQFVEIFEENADIIHHVRALRMTGEESSLPRAEVVVELMAELRDFAAETFEIARRNFRPCKEAQVLYFPFELIEFFFPGVSLHRERPVSPRKAFNTEFTENTESDKTL